MKTRTIICISCFIVSLLLFVAGAYKTMQVTDLINNFENNAKLGSSGGGYPIYDGVWIYFEAGSISLAAGILAIIWRKR